MNKREQAKQEAREALAQWVKVGTCIYTSLNRVSSTGMSRHISVYVMVDNEPINITYYVGKLLGYRRSDKTGGLVVGGCGMDMGYHVVHSLSYMMFPDGFECIGEGEERKNRCPSNDHSNGDRDYTPHHHTSGGYALRHDWL